MTQCDFLFEHWLHIRANNVIERLSRELRRRTRVVGTSPDGNSTLMVVCARLRHVAGTQWGNKKQMNMKHLEVDTLAPPLPADFIYLRACKPFLRKTLDARGGGRKVILKGCFGLCYFRAGKFLYCLFCISFYCQTAKFA